MPCDGDDYNGLLKMYDANKDKNPKFTIASVSEPTWEGVVALRTASKLLAGEERAEASDHPADRDRSLKTMRSSSRQDLPDGVFVDTTLSDDELKKLFS